jgi:hypothetical protein
MSRIEVHLIGDDGERMVLSGPTIQLRGNGEFKSARQMMDRLRVCAEIGEAVDFHISVPKVRIKDHNEEWRP